MKPVMDTLDIVVADVAASVAFYRCLGLEFQVDPNYAEHAGCDLPNGLHLMLDEEKPRWPAPVGTAARVARRSSWRSGSTAPLMSTPRTPS
ncbi:hypothetical protein ACGFI9_05035 [Micromonospora sp. NPDC048930]|uniref:hypothetical protein n=1 Tax=Micromonospora sp. NPDC048930 TaxID=3364261 RepID=UPI003713E272